MSEKLNEIIEKIQALPDDRPVLLCSCLPTECPVNLRDEYLMRTDDLKALATAHTALREKAAALVVVLNDDLAKCLNGDSFGKVLVAKFYDELAALRREMEARDKGFCFADEPQTTKPKDAIECLMGFGVQLGAEAKSTATNSLRARQCEIRSTAIFTVLDTLTQYRKALEGFGVTFADNGFIRMIPREAEGPEAEYDLPVCESCQKTLTIHDPIAETDGQSLLCFKCEQLERT